MLMADDATNSALHAAGYLRPDEREVNQRRFLPPSPDLTNPIVRQALVEVRKTVNAIFRELVYRLATLETTARRACPRGEEVLRAAQEIRFDNADTRAAREDAAKWIEDFDPSIKPTRATVNRYLLWKEQEEFCPYCGGRRSAPSSLFNGEADVDHILPRWRSLDDSMANKVVAHRRCNDEKGDRTPREWLEDSDPERYERVLQLRRADSPTASSGSSSRRTSCWTTSSNAS